MGVEIKSVRKSMMLCGLAAAMAMFAVAPAVRAQTAEPPPGPLAEPTKDPRDFTGIWQIRGYAIRYPVVGGGEAPYLPWAAAEAKRRGDAQKAGTPIADSTAQCLPSGSPRIWGAPYPIKILQTPKEVIVLHEVQHLFSFIFLNEEHPKELDPTFHGHSVGHWEGDTLVVDTVALKADTLINEAGDPHTDKLHVTMRWKKINDGKALENVVTIDDPGAYSKPWSIRFEYQWKPEIRFMEYICEENNRNDIVDGVVVAK